MDSTPHRGFWKRGLAILPGVGMALMPKVVCPACWPLYAAALAALGIRFIPSASYLLPLTLLFLAIAVAVLYVDGRRRGRTLPALLAAGAAVVILAGKFVLHSSAWLYGGLGVYLAASVWNSRRSCGGCWMSKGGESEWLQSVRSRSLPRAAPAATRRWRS